MTTHTAPADPPTAGAVDRANWRMDPPPPSDLLDLLHGAWPGALVAMLLLGLLLAFGSVVSDGVRRGEQLRQLAGSTSSRCDAQDSQTLALHCAVGDKPDQLRNSRMPVITGAANTRLLVQQR